MGLFSELFDRDIDISDLSLWMILYDKDADYSCSYRFLLTPRHLKYPGLKIYIRFSLWHALNLIALFNESPFAQLS